MAGVGVRRLLEDKGDGPPSSLKPESGGARTNSWAAALPFLCFQSVTELNQEQRTGTIRHDTHPRTHPQAPLFPLYHSTSARVEFPLHNVRFPIRTCACVLNPGQMFREHFPASHAHHLPQPSLITDPATHPSLTGSGGCCGYDHALYTSSVHNPNMILSLMEGP